MLNCTFRPLETWPRKETPHHRRNGRSYFSAAWGNTCGLLERELSYLQAKGIVIQIETDASQIRNDGWPRSDARVSGPKVAISFGSKHGPLAYYCDDFVFWQHNVRAIALTLERLRMAELYGVTKRGEQYQGFKALPPAIELGPAMSLEDAATVVARFAGMPPSNVLDKAAFQGCYRMAVQRCHPDRGGNADDWHRLQAAAELLKRHHGIA